MASAGSAKGGSLPAQQLAAGVMLQATGGLPNGESSSAAKPGLFQAGPRSFRKLQLEVNSQQTLSPTG